MSNKRIEIKLNPKKYFPKKMFGQNFLIDKNVALKIIKISNITKNDNILEIGPGKGFLTDFILNTSNAKNLIAIEIDNFLHDFLIKKFEKNKNFYLERGDCLKKNWLDLKIIPNKLIANIPYNITSQIIFKTLHYYKIFDSITIMVQNEIADRIVAHNNTKNFGVLTCITQKFWNVKKSTKLPNTVFYPKPKINSAILIFTQKLEKDHYLTKNIYANIYINFIKYCFNQRRKILVNRLLEISENEKINSNFFNTKNLNKKNIEIFFKTNNIKIDSRPENLSVENFYKLFEFMFDTSKFKN